VNAPPPPTSPSEFPPGVRARVIALAEETLAALAEEDVPASLKAVRRFTPAKRARLGATSLGAICVDLTRNGGTVLVYGVTRADETIAFHPFDLFRREISIIGSFAEITSFASAIAALRSGRIRTDGMITHRFPLDQYGAALECLRTDKSAHKVVIVP